MDPRISILAFPQSFEAGNLTVRILVVPRLSTAWNCDPLQPLFVGPAPGDTAVAFADADLRLEARIMPGLETFPVVQVGDPSRALPEASGVQADARPLFAELSTRFKISPTPRLADPAWTGGRSIWKYLPLSYRQSFLFTGPRTSSARTDDAYHCAIKRDKTYNPAFVVTPDDVCWGKVYAYCLRQPLLAERLGLIRAATFAVETAWLPKGGFVYVTLAPDSDYASQAAADPTFLKLYAARVPALRHAASRQLFGAVLLPVLTAPPASTLNYDDVLIDAAGYDDGFAKIAHSFQPVSQNLLSEQPDGFAPLNDIGIRLGWDDEQILIWQNRQLTDVGRALDSPMGVFGYRIDARQHGSPDFPKWHSLVHVRAKDALTLGAVTLASTDPLWDGELAVEVHPQQLDGDQAAGQFWLPSYFTQWTGTSLVLPDENAALLYKTEQGKVPYPERVPNPNAPDPGKTPSALGRLYRPLDLDQIPLHYGQVYDFRVRFEDPTGGGPDSSRDALHASASGVTTIPFRRHVQPNSAGIDNLPKQPPAGNDPFFHDNQLVVHRPLLGYPSVMFTGKYSDADALARLQAASDAAADFATPGKEHEAFGIPDPDVERVRIDIEVRTLRMDNLLSISGKEPYMLLYTAERKFAADFDQPCTIPLHFRDAGVLEPGVPGLGDLGLSQADIDNGDDLVLPTARDIRLTIRAVASDNADYFASGANIGKPRQAMVRQESSDETALFASSDIRGLYLQPDPPDNFTLSIKSLLLERVVDGPAIIQRLAQQLDVDHKGLTLVGRKGERVVFGCSRRIRHTLAPDHSSLTFAAKEDLYNHWIVPLIYRLRRDWTWDDLQNVSFDIMRASAFGDAGLLDVLPGTLVGNWEVFPIAAVQSLDSPQRDHTTLIFLDAVEPKPDDPAIKFPDIIQLRYEVKPNFRSAPAAQDDPESVYLTLPVTTPPAQVPQIVAAGIALSKYDRNDVYSKTSPRRRSLWIEFADAIKDPHDEYFIRLLGYASDPLLSDNRFETLTPPEESPLAIDPELIRVITGHAKDEQPTDDQSGLSAMIRLTPSDSSPRHFLVSLPPGLNADSPELFGFFTYELRAAHAHIWSTAQGRFSRALKVTGVQHPAPTLFCTTRRTQDELIAEAPYALAVINGKNITARPPRTQIWVLLYAQVRQADGKDYRNILLDDRELQLIPPPQRGKLVNPDGSIGIPLQNRDAQTRGFTRWKEDEIVAFLRELGLPADSPLSVLAVEMMPTLADFRNGRTRGGAAAFDAASSAYSSRSGFAGASSPAAEAVAQIRPLSDGLGNFRILRTSPLTEAGEICCTACNV
jgi:hypothetical protein